MGTRLYCWKYRSGGNGIMNELVVIKDDLNSGNFSRKLQAVLNLICDRMSEDEKAEKTFIRVNQKNLASHAKEFQEFNFIISSTLKALVDELNSTIKDINYTIEKALSEQRPNSTDNAQE